MNGGDRVGQIVNSGDEERESYDVGSRQERDIPEPG